MTGAVLACALGTGVAAVPAQAQDADLTARLAKLERELTAVQRRVFPGGDARFFEGQIQPPAATGATTPASLGGDAGNAAVGDIISRLDAIERQLTAMTSQNEQLGFRVRQLEGQLTALKDQQTAAASAAPTPATVSAPAPAAVAAPATRTPAAAAVAATPVNTSAARLALVKAVEVPATGNEVEDAYSYGFRLWQAKLYPEAQAQLKKVVERFPRHTRASYAQNLLGRAYLDEGKPSLATQAFYSNYKDRPQGERAPHSLLYMGIALDQLGRKADACKVYAELSEVYAATMPADVRQDLTGARSRSGC